MILPYRHDKGRDKKKVHETSSCTYVGNYVGYVGFDVDFTD